MIATSPTQIYMQCVDRVSQRVLQAYDLQQARLEPIVSLINRTLLATRPDGSRVILQRLHPVFGAEVNTDIAAVTEHISKRGLETPRLLRTLEGGLWVAESDGVWRAQTYVEGRTLHRVETPEQAHAAANFVARFHLATSDLAYDFVFRRAGVHDTPRHVARLRAALESPAGARDAEVTELGTRLLAHAHSVRLEFDTRARICHGDLKISNLLFEIEPPPAVRCLIDLDTLGPQTMAFELGDALRSWCNRSGEDVLDASVDEDIFSAAVQGYAQGAPGLLTEAEQDSIVEGLATVSFELACRFATDAVEDRYFGWDEARYASRRAHNLVRAAGQLALSRSVATRHEALSAIVQLAFRGRAR